MRPRPRRLQALCRRPRRQKRYRIHRIGDLGNERHGSHAECHALPAGFAALSDDNVHAHLGDPEGLRHGVDLVDELRSSCVGLLDEVCRVV